MLEVTETISEGRPFLFVANHHCINAKVDEVTGRYVYALVSDEDRGTLSGLVYLEAIWILSVSLPMLLMNYGCITVSQESGAFFITLLFKNMSKEFKIKLNYINIKLNKKE